MKTKFTLLIVSCLLTSVVTKAQDWSHENDNRDYAYKNDRHFDNRNNFDYRSQLFYLQQQLRYELNELDRAKAFGNWEKARHEKHEIAQLRFEIRKLRRHRYFDRDDYKDYDYH
ncbi:MAG: hypothetical protein JST47_05600 [Bacteroidetes bacterium]|nr:hypothetical protein [Bacteroidota bacterium]MBS1973840.1 hypothetical protein [Bacteroidota bacterium]